MSGSGANLPITIAVQGQQQAEAAFNAVAATGERAMQRVSAASDRATASGGGFRNAIGQAGFQLQDFAVQVQGGTSALTALSQQGSQFLGIFGPAGAIAGAVLTVGILAAQFLKLGGDAETAAGAQKRAGEEIQRTNQFWERYAQLIQAANDALLTNEQRTAARAQRDRAQLVADTRQQRETVLRDIEAAQRAINTEQATIDFARNDPSVQGNFAGPEAGIRAAQGRLAALGENVGFLTGRLNELDQALANFDRAGVDRGQQYDQPENPFAGARGGGRAGGLDSISRMVQRNTQNTEALQSTKVKMREIGDETQRTADITRTLGMTFTSAFEDAIVKGKSFRDVLGGIAEDLARLVLRQTVTAPLANALGSVVSGLFGPGGPAKGAPDPSLAGPFSYGGQRAMGGPVDPSSIYMVGERGPEMFVPNTAGNIVPNGGGGGVTLVMNVNAQGAGPREIDALRMQIPALARAAVEDAARRGGSFSRSVRGR